MSRMDLTITYHLEGLADGWTDETFLEFRLLDSAEATKLRTAIEAAGDDDSAATDLVKETLQSHFVAGKVVVKHEVVEAVAADIDDLPASVIGQLFDLISRSRFTDPKAGRR